MDKLKKYLFYFCLFISLFNLKLVLIPINSNIIFGIVGFFLWSVNQKAKNRYFVDRDIFRILLYLLFFSFISLCSFIYNGVVDISFIVEIILLNLLYIFATFFIAFIYRKSYKEEANFIMLVQIISIMIVFQIIIGFITFFSPNVYSFLKLFFTTSSLESNIVDGLLGLRPFGLGNYSFFGAGIINSLILILLAYLCSKKEYKYLRIRLIILYIIISLLGLVMARSTMIGIGLSLLVFVKTSNGRKMLSKLCIISACMIILFLSLKFPQNIDSRIELLKEFGYELFINYMDNGVLSTSSSDHMFNDMFILPQTFHTWVIGDGRFRDGTSYYMHTDIGYLRLIYYFGVLGCCVFFIYQFLLINYAKSIFKSNSEFMTGILFLLVILMNIKGLTNLSYYLLLFFFVAYDRKVSINKPCRSNIQRR